MKTAHNPNKNDVLSIDNYTSIIPGLLLTFGSKFTCLGGSSLAFIMAGFREKFACDRNPRAKETFEKNRHIFGNTPYLLKDVKDVSPDELLTLSGLKPGEMDVLEASTSCEKISRSNPKAYCNHPENYLYREVFKHMIPSALYPKVVVMENVAALADMDYKPLMDQIKTEAFALNYYFSYRVLNAMHYGVPQKRKRIIFIFVRKDIGIMPVFPQPLNFTIPLMDALPDIDCFSPGQFLDEIHYKTEVCCTLTSAENIWFYQNGKKRRPTIEECRVLQSFPECYILTGCFAVLRDLLGDAVPPMMMYHIAKTIRDEILLPYYTQRANKEANENSQHIRSFPC